MIDVNKIKIELKKVRTFLKKGDTLSLYVATGYLKKITEQIEKEYNIKYEAKQKKEKNKKIEYAYCQNKYCINENGDASKRKRYPIKDMHLSKEGLLFCSKKCYKDFFNEI